MLRVDLATRLSAVQGRSDGRRGGRSNLLYTPEDDAIIRELYPTMGWSVCKYLRGHTIGSIRSRAYKLGVKSKAPNDSRSKKMVLANAYARALAGFKPKGLSDVEEFSRPWYALQNKLFCEAMEANPTERPSEVVFKSATPRGRRRDETLAPLFLRIAP